jgi:antitoxin HigA-1
MTTTIAPIHPGEVLLEDFLTPLGVTQHHLAISISVPPRRINEIVHGKRRVTADTALRAGPLLRHQRQVLARPADPIRP